MIGRGGRSLVVPLARPPHAGRRLKTPRILLLGFALIFAGWALSVYETAVRRASVETEMAALNARLARAESLLATVRAQILLASVCLRDALQGGTPDEMRAAVIELTAARRRVDEALAKYDSLVDTRVERAMFGRLHDEIGRYWAAASPAIAAGRPPTASESQGILRRVFIPQREMIFNVSEDVQALKREAFARQQAETTRLYRRSEQWLAASSAVALVLGLGVAVVVVRYSARLEKRLRDEQAKEAGAARDLQRLSARLVEAHEEERRTVARELHDEVGQALTAIKMELSHAERPRSADTGPPALEGAKHATDHALHVVRDLTRLLHPRILEELGLSAALAAHVAEFSRRTGVRAEFVDDGGAVLLDRRLGLPAFRIVQEALTNVARHASATECRVSFATSGDTVCITVRDNGTGFDPKKGAASGVGLLGIQERVAGCGGQYRLETTPGCGTSVTVCLPMSVQDEAAPRADAATLA